MENEFYDLLHNVPIPTLIRVSSSPIFVLSLGWIVAEGGMFYSNFSLILKIHI